MKKSNPNAEERGPSPMIEDRAQSSTEAPDPPKGLRGNYRAPRFTDTYDALGNDAVALLERHWSVRRGERRPSMLPDIANLRGSIEFMGELDGTRKRRLRETIRRAWKITGVELQGRLATIEELLTGADPDSDPECAHWLHAQPQVTGDLDAKASVEFEAVFETERARLRANVLAAVESLAQIEAHFSDLGWLARAARGRVLGTLVTTNLGRRLKSNRSLAIRVAPIHGVQCALPPKN